MQRQIEFKARLAGAIGEFQTFYEPWPERASREDVLKLYDVYDHIQQVKIVLWNDDAEKPDFVPYPEFFQL